MSDPRSLGRGTCYQSSALATLTDPTLTYVEGVLVADLPTDRLTTAHAWNERPDGSIDDITLLDVLRDAPDVTLTYIPVRRGTDLTVAELDARGNPDDLTMLARYYLTHDTKERPWLSTTTSPDSPS